MYHSPHLEDCPDVKKLISDLQFPSYLPRKFKRIHLELTNHCNFSCLFCPDAKMTRKRGFMDVDLAYSALDQISDLDLAEKVTFHVMGEPLLHPKFLEILDHAQSVELPVGLTTNGALLRPGTIRAIAERDLHQVDISLQNPDRESFRLTRGTRMDFDTYQNGLLDLLAACASRPSPPIFKIRIMTTRFARKLREKLDIPNFIGSSQALRSTVLAWSELIYQRLGLNTASLSEKVKKVGIHGWNVIEITPGIFIETYVLTDWANAFSEEAIVEAGYGYCFGMRDHFAILHSGDVTLCCIDYDGNTAIGNLHEATLLQVLQSPELEKIMKGFRRTKLVHPYCRQCLGTSSRLGSWVKPIMAVAGLKILKPFFYRQYKLYDESDPRIRPTV